MAMNRIAALALVASAAWTTAGAANGAPPWVSWDAASKTVTFTLEAGAPASGGPFNSMATVMGRPRSWFRREAR